MKKKIGVVLYSNPDYYPPTINAIHLLSEKYDVILVGRNQEPPNWKYPSNVEVHRLGHYSSVREREKASIYSKLLEYINFLRKNRNKLKKVSLIYVYDPFSFVAICLCEKLNSKKIPIVYHHHETSEIIFSLTTLSGWIQRLERQWICRANIIVFPELERSNLFKTLIDAEIFTEIVPNFPLKSYFNFDRDWETLIKQRWENIILFYRGTISNTTSMKEIVASLSLISHKIRVNFVGFLSEHNAAELTNCISQNGQDSIFTYLGVLPYEELQPHTLNSSLGFALYKNISFDRVACATACNKIYEYAACGLPIIVSKFPTYQNYLGEESWVRFADPEDPKSIALAIEDILSDFDIYRKMCLSARKAFEEKFNYETVFEPIMDRIKELVD